MAFQRSVANGASGSTLPLRPALEVGVEAVPSTGPRSARRNCREVTLPDSLPRGAPDAKRRWPCRSLWPTVPVKSR